ncbi:MAG: glycosyltransferase family 4 protein [archaeon]
MDKIFLVTEEIGTDKRVDLGGVSLVTKNILKTLSENQYKTYLVIPAFKIHNEIKLNVKFKNVKIIKIKLDKRFENLNDLLSSKKLNFYQSQYNKKLKKFFKGVKENKVKKKIILNSILSSSVYDYLKKENYEVISIVNNLWSIDFFSSIEYRKEYKPSEKKLNSIIKNFFNWFKFYDLNRKSIVLKILYKTSYLIKFTPLSYLRKEFKMIKKSDKLIFPSKHLLNYVNKNYPKIKRRKNYLLKHHIMTQNVKVKNYKEINFYLINRLLKKQKMKFLLISRIHPQKGLILFFNSLKYFINKHPEYSENISFALCGDFTKKNNLYFQKIEKIINQLPIKIIYFGKVDSKFKSFLFRDCDFFILPSIYEPFGISIIEALSYKKPIITTDCGGPETILGEKYPLMIKRKNFKQSMEKILLRILSNPKRVIKVKNEYNYKKLKELFIKVIND